MLDLAADNFGKYTIYIHQSVCLSVCLSVYLSTYLDVDRETDIDIKIYNYV